MAPNDSIQSSNCRLFYYLKIIGIVALVVGGISLVTLVLLLSFLTLNTGTAYLEIVKSGSMTRQSLAPGLLLAGLFLVAAAAAVTWLISLYASFRIAGPLFRFSRNMEILIESGSVALIPIRKDDQLQEEARHFVQSVDLLQNHYREMGAATDNALALTNSGGHGLAQALAKLRELDHRVHF